MVVRRATCEHVVDELENDGAQALGVPGSLGVIQLDAVQVPCPSIGRGEEGVCRTRECCQLFLRGGTNCAEILVQAAVKAN